jgi:dipeptidyl aminopeptidase/acylaminoacyl peptidase
MKRTANVEEQVVPRLVYTGGDDNVFIRVPSEAQSHQLTWSWEEGAPSMQEQETRMRLAHAWPTWAPDESRVACFGMRGSEKSKLETLLYVVSADGVESWELANLAGGMPIYGNWSPRANSFASLVQRGEQHLSLEVAWLDNPGKTISLVSGAPLFWSWSPQGDRLAVHVRDSRKVPSTARVLILEAASGRVVREVSTSPGEFRVPIWSPREDLLAYVESNADGGNTLFLLDVESGDKAPLGASAGMMSALWSPDGRSLAFGESSQANSAMFSTVKIMDLDSGRISPCVNEAAASFFWSPPGDALCYLTIDSQRSHLCWNLQHREADEKTELIRFLPSREQMLVMSFFDQYALSHPPVAPDGSAVTLAGYLLDKELLSSDVSKIASRVYTVPLAKGAHPQAVGRGQFACWNLPA